MRGSYPLQSNVLCEGPIPSSQIFCARVLSPPVKCVVRGSYPLQSNVLCEGPIPSSQMFRARVLSPPVKCFVRGSYPLQSNVLCEGPIPSSQIFCARVLSPPFECLVRGSYPLQLIVLCEGPIPSSLYAMPIGFGFLCSCRTFDPYLHSSVLYFHLWGRQCLLFAIATPWRWGHFFSLSNWEQNH